MAQITLNQTKDRDTKEVATRGSRIGRIGQFTRSKFAPGIPALIANELWGNTFIGEDLEGRSDKGRLPNPKALPLDDIADKLGINNVREVEALKQVIPLFSLNLIDSLDEHGFLRGGALSSLELFGVGAQTFNEPRDEVEAQQQQSRRNPSGLTPVGGGSFFENR